MKQFNTFNTKEVFMLNVFKMCVLLLFTFYSLFFILCTNLFASLTELPVGAKYIALGGLGTTNTDDVYSVYYNPALLDIVDRHQIAAEYTGLFLGLNDTISHTFFAYAIPSKSYGSFGVYIENFSADGYYNEMTFALSYGKSEILKSLERLDLGLRIKGTNLSYNPDEVVYTNDGLSFDGKDSMFLNTSSKFVFSIDLGLNYNLADNYKFGILLKDILEPNVSLINTDGVVIPRKIIFGVSNINPSYGLNLDFEVKDKDFVTTFGVQKKFKIPLTLLSSIKYTSRNYSYKTVQLIEPSFGLEYNFDGIKISYAFNYPLSGIDVFGNHTISFLYKFGNVIKFKEDTRELREKVESLNKQLQEKDLEIEQLRKKLDELLSQPTKQAQKSVSEEKAKEIPKIVLETQTPQEKYNALLKAYFDRKEKLTFVDKLKVIETLVKQFKGTVDVSKAQKEYDELRKEQEAMINEYEQSRSYYLRLKSRGGGISELLGVLNRMIEKYSDYGIDVQWAKDEKEKILRR
jgi:hypothetical protein